MDSAPPYPRFDGSQRCREIDPETFFPVSARDSYFFLRRARPLCADCPFLQECRDYAISYDVHGFWGGMTRRERIEERRRLGIAAIKVTATESGMVRQLLEEIDDGARPASEVAFRVGCSTATVLRARRTKAA